MSTDTPCGGTNCPQSFVDGFCDLCGLPQASTAEGETLQATIPQVREEHGYSTPIITRVSRSDMDAARAARLNAGHDGARSSAPRWPLPSYTPAASPLDKVMARPVLPPGKATCSHCGKPVDTSGRFCDACGTEHAFRPALAVGDLVAGQYQNAGCIAYGSMGWIYLARDVRLDRWVVLKGLLNGEDKGAAASAILEKRYLSAMRHPGIVAIHDYVEHAGRSYIVMEYVDGISLKEFRALQGPLSIHEALGCLLHLLPSLEALHEAGLAYCDLKPDNLMLVEGGIKLIDLGAARSIGETGEDIYGSPGYMPDLQGPDRGIPSVAMDVYSAGRTLAALLLDFDNTGEHQHSLPASRMINRMLGTQELERLVGSMEGEPRFSLPNGERLPAWLSVSSLVDRKGDAVYVLHGSAPDGFSKLDVEVHVEWGGTGVVALSCPLALQSLRSLLERSTHNDPEGRFAGAADMAMHCAGILRELLGAEGLPPQGVSTSFSQSDGDVAALVPYGTEWMSLPPPLLNKEDKGFEAVARALDERSDDARMAALHDAVRAGDAGVVGIDAHLRYVEAFLSSRKPEGGQEAGDVRHFLRLAVQARPWDWRPAWMEAKYWMSLGKHAEAASCLGYVARILPGESLPKVALGMALQDLGDPASALALHQVALRASPRFALARLMRVRCMFLLCDPGFKAAYTDLGRDFPAMGGEFKEFMRRNVLSGNPESFAGRAGQMLDVSQEDAATYRRIASFMRTLSVPALEPSGQTVQSLEALADAMDPPPPPMVRASGLAGSLGKAFSGIMGSGRVRTAP